MMARAPVILFVLSTSLHSVATGSGKLNSSVDPPGSRVEDYASYYDTAEAPAVREVMEGFPVETPAGLWKRTVGQGPRNLDRSSPSESPPTPPGDVPSSEDGLSDLPPVSPSRETGVTPSFQAEDEDLTYTVKFLLFLWIEHFQSVGVALVLCLLSTVYTLVWRWCFRSAASEEPGPLPSAPPPSPGALSTTPAGRGGTEVTFEYRQPACPRCGRPMTIRHLSGGSTVFWGCPQYRATVAACSGTRDVFVRSVVRFE